MNKLNINHVNMHQRLIATLFIFAILSGCNNDDEIVLLDEYNLETTITGTELFARNFGEYEEFNDADFEDILDSINMVNITAADALFATRMYERIAFTTGTTGRIDLLLNSESMDFTYTKNGSDISVFITALNKEQEFLLLDGGNAISGCVFIAIAPDVDSGYYNAFEEVSCGAQSYLGTANMLLDEGIITADTIGLFEIQHTTQ